MTEPTSGCTINGEPAVVIRIAELNDLTARLHQAEAAAATPAELERRQRYTWHAAGLCPMCSHEDGKGWLCDVCTADVRRMKPRDRKPWRRFEQPSAGAPIQGSGYSPAGLLGITPDNPPASDDAADNPAAAAPATADDGLRERVAVALRTTPATDATHEPGEEKWDHHPRPGEQGHRYTHTCALCRNDVDALADAVLAVRDDELREARATNQRLNHRAQQAESGLTAVTRAVAEWKLGEHGTTYVPLRTLTAIARAVGRPVEAGRYELHYQRVETAEAAIARVRALAADMRDWCSPHGIAVDYAQRIDDALDTQEPTR